MKNKLLLILAFCITVGQLMSQDAEQKIGKLIDEWHLAAAAPLLQVGQLVEGIVCRPCETCRLIAILVLERLPQSGLQWKPLVPLPVFLLVVGQGHLVRIGMVVGEHGS